MDAVYVLGYRTTFGYMLVGNRAFTTREIAERELDKATKSLRTKSQRAGLHVVKLDLMHDNDE